MTTPPESEIPPASDVTRIDPPAPYRNLWVTLVVVPAVVVGVLVLVYVFFSSIAGTEATLEENLNTMLRGGTNQRQQAAFSLVRQIRAAADGLEPEWVVSPEFLSEARSAWDELAEDDLTTRLVLAQVLAQSGDVDLERFRFVLEAPEELDEKGVLRFHTLVALKDLGRPEAAELAIPFLHHEDQGLRVVAAAALQAMPGKATSVALRGALSDSALEVRGTAAVSLSHLGDDSGAALLSDLAGTEIYAEAKRADPRKFTQARIVRENRIQAVQALARLGRQEDRELLESLAALDEDLDVREAAKRAVVELDAR